MPAPTPEARLARVEAELDGVQRLVETFGPVARQALETDLRTQELTRTLGDFRGWLEDVEERLSRRIGELSTEVGAIRRDLTTRDENRAKSRTTIIVAAIGATATIIATLGAALIALGGPH